MSAGLERFERFDAAFEATVDFVPKRRVLFGTKFWVLTHKSLRDGSSIGEQFHVPIESRQAQVWQSRLALPKQLARTAQRQIVFGERKPVSG